MTKLIEYTLSIPKSLYVSIRLMGFKKGIRLPILVRNNVKLLSLRGLINVNGGGKFGMIKFGFGELGIFDKKYQRTILQIDGDIILDYSNSQKNISFSMGSRICVYPNATLTLGGGVVSSACTTIVCKRRIKIGEEFLSSWNTFITDTDFHGIKDIKTGETNIYDKPVVIGSNVWMCMNSSILKGCTIPDGSIVAAHSVVTKSFTTPNVLLAGNPAKIIKEKVTIDETTK